MDLRIQADTSVPTPSTVDAVHFGVVVYFTAVSETQGSLHAECTSPDCLFPLASMPRSPPKSGSHGTQAGFKLAALTVYPK